MKIRAGFVTNSSSSSYICVSKIDYSEKLKEYFKDEFGKHGIRLLERYLQTGAELIKSCDLEDYIEDGDIEIENSGFYLTASFVEVTNEGATDGDDAWLYNHIPTEYKEEIFHGGC